jgi:hypothetical protein
MNKEHLKLLESPEYFTVMSHEIVLKTLLRFNQAEDIGLFNSPRGSLISAANFYRLLSQIQIATHDPKCGPFASYFKLQESESLVLLPWT